MVHLNDLHPNNLFRFVQLRGPEKADKEKSKFRFIRYDFPDLKPEWRTEIEGDAYLLYPKILAEKDAPDAAARVRTLAVAFKNGHRDYWPKLEALEKRYPALAELVDWMDSNRAMVTLPNFVKKAGMILGMPIKDFVNRKAFYDMSLRIWDNLFVQVIEAGIQPMEAELTKYLGMLNVLYCYFKKDDFMKSNDDINNVYTAMVLIPAWLVEVLVASSPNPDEGIGTHTSFLPDNWPNEGNISNPGGGIPVPPRVGHVASMIGNTPVVADEVCHEMKDPDPCARLPRKAFPTLKSFFNSVFIGDLLITRQQLIKYDLGEVAHIENVMKSEHRERTHRRLDRTEVTTTFEKETSEEIEKDLQSTERFSMEKESEKSLNTDFKVHAGVDVTADFGKVKLTTKADVNFGLTTKETNKEVTKFSKDVTSKALERIKRTLKETRTVKILNEVEETNQHIFDNKDAAGDHVVGVYRWVDKFYLNKVINYGKRMMLEFTVPEPANFYIFSKLNRPKSGESKVKPIHPKDVTIQNRKLTDFTQLTVDNYVQWAALYGATGVTPPPSLEVIVEENFSPTTTMSLGTHGVQNYNTLKVPAGYTPLSYRLCYTVHADNYPEMKVFVGNNIHVPEDSLKGRIPDVGDDYKGTYEQTVRDTRWNSFDTFQGSETMEGLYIPVTVATYDIITYAISVEVRFRRNWNHMANWQIKTYESIMSGYRAQLRDYEDWEKAQTVGAGVQIEGNNPEINRVIERTELKKRCIELFSGQRFDSFDAATNGIHNQSGYPEILFEESVIEGEIVKFFEILFDWANMTYIFYPYFWGRKHNWLTNMNLDDNDPTFGKFLQAGFARVVVPVRKNFERLALNYVWKYGEGKRIHVPLGSPMFNFGIDHEYYISIAEEIQSAEGLSEETGTIVGTYVQKVPTNLVYLKPTKDDPNKHYGLPDNSEKPDIKPYL